MNELLEAKLVNRKQAHSKRCELKQTIRASSKYCERAHEWRF